MALFSLDHVCKVNVDDLRQLVDCTLQFKEPILTNVFGSFLDYVEILILDAELAILNCCESIFESSFAYFCEILSELHLLFHHLVHSFHENAQEIVFLVCEPQFENFVHYSILLHQAQMRHSLKLFIREDINASAEFLVLLSEVELSFLVVNWGEE